MESGERMRLQAIISELVSQLGGEATIKEADLITAKDIQVSVNHDGIYIKVEAKKDVA